MSDMSGERRNSGADRVVAVHPREAGVGSWVFDLHKHHGNQAVTPSSRGDAAACLASSR